MKLSAALMCILFSSLSFAGQNQAPPTQSGPQQPKPQIPIFEKARVKVTMFKNTIERVGDTYQEHREVICTSQLSIDVPDTRQYHGPLAQLPSIKCPANTDHQAFELTVWLYSLVEKYNNRDLKSYWAHMTAGPNETGNLPGVILPGTNSASTIQLDLKSMIFSLAPPQGVYCKTPEQPNEKISRALPLHASDQDCGIFNPVAFGATVEFESL